MTSIISMFGYFYDIDMNHPEIRSTDQVREPVFSIHLYLETPNNPIKHQSLILLQRGLLNGCVFCSMTLSRCLSALGVPSQHHPLTIDRVASYASCAANAGRSSGGTVIPLDVHISYGTRSIDYNEDQALDEAITRSIEEQDLNFVPASESSIRGLKEVRVEECSQMCVICLEAMEVGSKAAAIRCSHLYHSDCIGKWLRTSGLCPLCRCDHVDV